MPLLDLLKKAPRHRFERFNIVFAILLAGWVPSILTLVVSYTILSRTLETRILRDRQTFVQLIARLVGDDLSRTGGIIELARKTLTPERRAQVEIFERINASDDPLAAAMDAAERDAEFVASFPPERPELREAEMMRIRGFARWRRHRQMRGGQI